ncbi:MAG: DUF547 domain-containing protein [Burkholderiales bacterium]
MEARLSLLALALCCAQALAFEHRDWDGLLKKHVVLRDGGKASQVRYSGMAQDRAALGKYLSELSEVKISEFKGWSRAEQMAFLINAYNAFTVEKILTRYPGIGSIWDFGKLFGNPFKDEFFVLLQARRSLDWIEHETLRKTYRDARIHYAVNCAAVGCPMLREEAYTAARLEAQLEDQARRFLSDRSRNRVRDGRLEVSKIFDWFRQDFEPRERYFAPYAGVLADSPGDQKLVRDGKARLSFLDYDWTLNDSRSSSRR